MSPRATPSRLAALATATLILTACSAGPEAGETTPSPTTTPPTDQDTLTFADSPLGKIWSTGSQALSDEDQRQAGMAQDREIQEAMARCMAHEGFEYTPIDFTGTYAWELPRVPEPGDREYAERYGYGISTWDLIPRDDAEWPDPYEDARAAVDESERDAWTEAFWGTDLGPDATDEERANAKPGCYHLAHEEVLGQEPPADPWQAVYADPQFDALFLGAEGVSLTVDASPEMTALHQAWFDCMARVGFPGLATSLEAEEQIQAEWDALQSGGDEPTAAQVADLREREIAMATAELDCQDEVDFEQTRLRIQFDAEQEYIDTHRDEFDAMIAVVNKAAAEPTPTSAD